MRIVVTVEATPHEGEPFTEEDLEEAVRAACLEVHPVRDGQPVVPKVERAGLAEDFLADLDAFD